MYTYNRGGVGYRYSREGLSYGVGVDLQHFYLEGVIPEADARLSNSHTHLLPSASLDYEINVGKNLGLRYNASTWEPSMGEQQPYTDNTDPFNVYRGNPDLRPEYQHSAYLRFSLFDQFTFTNLFAFARTQFSTNSILQSRTIDEQFRQTRTSVNAGSMWPLTGNISFGTPLRKLRSKINLSTQTVYNRGIEFINAAENTTRIFRSTVDLRFGNRNKEFFDTSLGARYTFNVNRYSLNQNLNQSYTNRSFYTDLTLTPSVPWSLSTSLDYRLYTDDVFGTGKSLPFWTAQKSRSFMDNRVQVQMVASDLLNQSVAVIYSNTNSYVQEQQINSLGRYVMLKVVYSLSGFDGDEGIRNERL